MIVVKNVLFGDYKMLLMRWLTSDRGVDARWKRNERLLCPKVGQWQRNERACGCYITNMHVQCLYAAFMLPLWWRVNVTSSGVPQFKVHKRNSFVQTTWTSGISPYIFIMCAILCIYYLWNNQLCRKNQHNHQPSPHLLLPLFLFPSLSPYRCRWRMRKCVGRSPKTTSRNSTSWWPHTSVNR